MLDSRAEVGVGERVAVFPGVTLVPDSGLRHYSTTSTTALRMMPGTDSTQGIIKATLDFSVAYSRFLPQRTRVSGTLTRISLATEGLSQASDQESYFPLEFTGHVESGGLHLDSLAGSPISTVVDCQTAGLNLMTTVQRNMVVSPLVLSTGTTWTDSSTVPACSGSIQVALTAIRTYTVRGQVLGETQPVIVVDRQDRVRAAGNGAQGQHRITVSSHGSGSARLYLDRVTGSLRESRSTQTIDVVIGSSGRSQHFRQVVEEQTRLQ